MDKSITTKKEVVFLNRWMQVLRRDLNNSQFRLGDCLSVQDDEHEAEYWRGCIDTTLHFLAMMEASLERENDGL